MNYDRRQSPRTTMNSQVLKITPRLMTKGQNALRDMDLVATAKAARPLHSRSLRGEPKLREPIRIHVTQGYSMQEIAQTLDVTVATVKARQHRARRRLTASRALGNSGLMKQS